MPLCPGRLAQASKQGRGLAINPAPGRGRGASWSGEAPAFPPGPCRVKKRKTAHLPWAHPSHQGQELHPLGQRPLTLLYLTQSVLLVQLGSEVRAGSGLELRTQSLAVHEEDKKSRAPGQQLPRQGSSSCCPAVHGSDIKFSHECEP